MIMCTLLIKPAIQSLTIKLFLVVVQLFLISSGEDICPQAFEWDLSLHKNF